MIPSRTTQRVVKCAELPPATQSRRVGGLVQEGVAPLEVDEHGKRSRGMRNDSRVDRRVDDGVRGIVCPRLKYPTARLEPQAAPAGSSRKRRART